jgi:hypothetical protein
MEDSQPTPVDLGTSRTIGKEQILRAILLALLIVLIVASSIPSYLSQQWPWANFPVATNIKQVKRVLGKGIQLPEWNTYVQQMTEVGSHRWSIQAIGKTPEKPILLFLRPQTDNPESIDKLTKPEVDWEDIQGYTQDFTDTPERWVENLTYSLLRERFEKILDRTNPNPVGGNGSDILKQEFTKGLSPWFQERFMAEFERQSKKSFDENFAKPLQASLGITFPAWVDKQLKNAFELGLSSWTKTRFSQPNSDSYRDLKFSIEDNSQSLNVTARLFRAWNDKQTFAVVQWYARPDGGHYSPANWFWADRAAQLQERRLPWIAVCLKYPIQPLGELDRVEAELKALASEIQQTLVRSAFTEKSSTKNSQSS